MICSSSVRGGVYRLAHLLEGAAAADIGNRFVDVLVGRLRLLLQKRRHRHDHAALAIAALGNVIGNPGLLHLVQGAVVRQSLDRGDLLADRFAHRNPAGADGDAVDMDGAGAALCNAATVFGAGQANIFPDRPEQRRIGLDVDVDRFSVNCEVCHRDSLFGPIHRLNGAGIWTGIWNSSNQYSASNQGNKEAWEHCHFRLLPASANSRMSGVGRSRECRAIAYETSSSLPRERSECGEGGRCEATVGWGPAGISKYYNGESDFFKEQPPTPARFRSPTLPTRGHKGGRRKRQLGDMRLPISNWAVPIGKTASGRGSF